MRGIELILNEDKYLNIKNGRYLLLDKKKVVVNIIYLGRDFYILVIIGLNIGGKIVIIKIVGLFVFMI